jgi:DNA modification methylase
LPIATPQLRFPYASTDSPKNGTLNKVAAEDQAAHRWYRFVLSFPPHLVRDYLAKFGATSKSMVLDPFCGTGTTLVECKKLGIPSVGVEAHPMAQFAAKAKVDWSLDSDGLVGHSNTVAKVALSALEELGVDDSGGCLELTKNQLRSLQTLPAETSDLLLKDSISPLPLHKTLILLGAIKGLHDPRYCQHELLALAKAAVSPISNLHFGPEVGVQKPKKDAAVISAWLHEVSSIATDASILHLNDAVPAAVHLSDSRSALTRHLRPDSIDIVVTSPPYPNEKDYTRTTRLESVLLGFIRNRADLKELKRTLVRSNTRNVYKLDDDDKWVAEHKEIQRIASAIEKRRIQLGKTSGFERLYARVAKLYFGGMVRHLRQLTEVLRPGAHLAYVVGDQASYLRIMIRTGQILADLAQQLGFEVLSIDLFRTRLATATKEQMREEVVVLRWPGKVVSRNRAPRHERSTTRARS